MPVMKTNDITIFEYLPSVNFSKVLEKKNSVTI